MFKANKMTKQLLTIILLINVSLTAFGQTDGEYSNTLKKMFEVSGSEESYRAVIQQMFTMYKKQYSDVDAAVWNDLEKEFLKTSLNELTEMLTPVYAKYMTQEDLNGIIKFYETPVGGKFAKNTPLILQESMQIGQQWGMKIGQDFANKMKEKEY